MGLRGRRAGGVLAQEAEVVALPRIIIKRWPAAGVDVLVNNAGMGRDNAALCSGATASWVEMVSTNILGLCMATREAVQVDFVLACTLVHARCFWPQDVRGKTIQAR